MLAIFLNIVLIEVTLEVEDLLWGKVVFIAKLDQEFIVVQLAGESLSS